jgi:hypothetical protein
MPVFVGYIILVAILNAVFGVEARDWTFNIFMNATPRNTLNSIT